MLFEREKRLLALLDALGGEIGGLDFQKLLFLYCHEMEAKPTYEFVPYRYGGFSFTSYADKRRLAERGLLEDWARRWVLTEKGRSAAAVTGEVRVRMHQFARRYAGVRGEQLISEVYRHHPYYAIRSQSASRILASDLKALAAIATVRPIAPEHGLFTIGYEGRSLEGYLNRLIQAGITLLCDVRRNPVSRKFGFSKVTLSRVCRRLDIRYEHLPELGIASTERQSLKTRADYQALFATYKRETLPSQTDALMKIHRWVKDERQRVALTCFERSPHQCHRYSVGEALERMFGRDFAPVHL
jgi:uncharacterized protein (DUF488 family)